MTNSPCYLLQDDMKELMSASFSIMSMKNGRLGDFVLSGGELAAMVFIDAIIRLIPGSLGHLGSAEQDSFMNGLLDCPHYTRPATIDGLDVPPVLLGGNHRDIERWRRKQSLGKTWLKRPDLLEKIQLSETDKQLLAEFKCEHGDSC